MRGHHVCLALCHSLSPIHFCQIVIDNAAAEAEYDALQQLYQGRRSRWHACWLVAAAAVVVVVVVVRGLVD